MKTTHQNNERNDLRTKTHVRNFLLRLHCGFASLLHTPALWVVSLAYWAVVLLLPHIITAPVSYTHLTLPTTERV